jgi:hypothetical protein
VVIVMKKNIVMGLRIIFRVIVVLLIFVLIDIACVFIINRPILAVKKDNIYKGLFYNVYNCGEYSIPQIKLKSEKFSCDFNTFHPAFGSIFVC